MNKRYIVEVTIEIGENVSRTQIKEMITEKLSYSFDVVDLSLEEIEGDRTAEDYADNYKNNEDEEN